MKGHGRIKGARPQDVTGDTALGRRKEALDYDLARDLWCVLGLPVDSADAAQAEAVLRAAVDQGRQVVWATPNVNWVVAALTDPDFRRAAIDSELCTADGMPLVWAARLLGLPIPERVAGSGLIEKLLSDRGERPLSIFLFGGDEGVAKQAFERINARDGGLEAVGWLYPGYGSVETMSGPDTIAAINDAAPDILLVAVGARKGQAWIERNRGRLNARVISPLGATINFLAGTVARAPAWVQRAGLEWLWRIAAEPKLVGRYAKDGGVLTRLVLTRLLPYWLLLKTRGRRREIDAPIPGVELTETSIRLRVVLRGTAVRATMGSATAALRRAVLADRDLVVDLAHLDYIDSAFIALLMIVAKHNGRSGRRLRVEGASAYVRRLFRYNCAEFLLRREG